MDKKNKKIKEKDMEKEMIDKILHSDEDTFINLYNQMFIELLPPKGGRFLRTRH